MTRINTNVSALNAQKTLARSNASLQESLTRLSTGLRINKGRDDPAGLIASETLRADMIATEQAITNSTRANQLIATADSALGQVSSLLNDIRGLVSEAANDGAMSTEQIAANQLQIDSSLEAIDRIAKVTQFQGRRLLDGNLDFITSGVENTQITNMQIDQANFGALTQIDVSIDVVAQADKGSLNYAYSTITEDVVLEIGGKEGSEAFSFASGSTVEDMAAAINLVSDATGVAAEVASASTSGAIHVSSLGADNDMVLTADTAGFEAGNMRVKYTEGTTAATTVAYTAGSGAGDAGTIDIALEMETAAGATGTTNDDSLLTQATLDDYGTGVTNFIAFTAVESGNVGNGYTVEIIDDGGALAAGTARVQFNETTGALLIEVDSGVTDANTVIATLNADPIASQFVTAAIGGTGTTGAGTVAATAETSLAGAEGDVNNDMVITAKQMGTDFNATAVHVVSGNATAKGISSLNNDATATLSVGAASISLQAKEGGDFGNDIVVNVGASVGTVHTIGVTGNTINIVLSDGTGAGTQTTAALLQGLIESSPEASALVDVTGIAAGNMDTLEDSTFHLNNGHKASRSFTSGTETLTFTAKERGPAGDDVEIVWTESVAAASVTVTGNSIAINVDTAGTTGLQIETLLLASDAALRLIDVGREGLTTGVDYTGVTAGTTVNLTTEVTGVGGADSNVQAEVVEYSADAKAASASVDWGNTASDANDIIITARQTGTAYNNVAVEVSLVNGLGTANTSAVFDTSTDTLTITIDDTTDTPMLNIKNAVEAVVDSDGAQLFSVSYDDSANDVATDAGIVDVSTLTNGQEVGNTANTGGEAGTLFLYVEEGVTTANDVQDQLANVKAAGTGDNDNFTARAAELFTFANAGNNDGTGALFEQTMANLLADGVDAGQVAADAGEVIAAINADTALGAVVTAALATGDDGKNVAVSTFEESATYGSAATANHLQFLGGTDSADIQFVASGMSTALSIEDSRGQASLIKESDAADAVLTITARSVGSDYDGVRVVYVDDDNVTVGNEIVTYNEETKTLQFQVATGNSAGNNTTAADITAAIDADDVVNQLFVAANYGTSDGTGDVTADLAQASADLSYSAGADVVHIRSDAYGTAGSSISVVVANAATPSVSFASNTLTINVTVASTNVAELAELVNTATGGQFTATVTQMNTAGAVTAGTTAMTGGLGTDADTDGALDQATTDQVTAGGRGDPMAINLATDSEGIVTTTAGDLITFFADAAGTNATMLNNYGVSASLVGNSLGTGTLAATTADLEMETTGLNTIDQQATGASVAVEGIDARFTVTAVNYGADWDGVSVVLQNDDTLTAGNETASYDATTKTLTVLIDQTNTNANQVIAAITSDVGTIFTAATGGGSGGDVVTTGDALTLADGTGTTGSVQGVALVGNEDQAATGIDLVTSDYGSGSFVSVSAISGSFATTDSDGNTATRSYGTDVDVRINGIQAVGEGSVATMNTASLDLSFTLDTSVAEGDSIDFSILGGGARFQLGPDVVSNQQARLGIRSMNTAQLGSSAGRMFELRLGQTKSLDNDILGAANVVEDVITQVTTLRGRLGAFQKTTLDTNIAALSETLEALTAAESDIRDTDFAKESANLTRAQILVQSGLSVLGIAKSNPQSVLSLLR